MSAIANRAAKDKKGRAKLRARLEAAGVDPQRIERIIEAKRQWEFGVYAMEDVPDPDDSTTWRFLTPQNVVVQVPDHPLELVVGVMRALGPVLVADGTRLPLEPMFQRDLDPVWRETVEAMIAHPHHRNDL